MKAFDFIKNNKILSLAILAIIFAFTTLIYSQLQPKSTSPIPIPIFSPSPSTKLSTSPTPKPNVSQPVAGEKYQTISGSDQEQLRRDSLVSQLLSKLPYTGSNFSLVYDYSRNQFIVTLQVGKEDSGNKELDLFLQTNHIESRSWLNNLTIRSQ